MSLARLVSQSPLAGAAVHGGPYRSGHPRRRHSTQTHPTTWLRACNLLPLTRPHRLVACWYARRCQVPDRPRSTPSEFDNSRPWSVRSVALMHWIRDHPVVAHSLWPNEPCPSEAWPAIRSSGYDPLRSHGNIPSAGRCPSRGWRAPLESNPAGSIPVDVHVRVRSGTQSRDE